MRRPKKEKRFDEREFVKKVWGTMKDQARKDPIVALLHERLEGRIRLIGVTGGIASGKSLVSSYFKEAKVPVIDADEIAREVVRPGKPAYQQIRQVFGEGILFSDGSLDRERLGEIIFSDEGKRRLLESITHPEIVREIAKRVSHFKKKGKKRMVIDAALLFESGLDRVMHKNILVQIDPNTQLKRLMARDRLQEPRAWQRILSQMQTPEKKKRADFVVDNSGPREETHRQVLEIIKKIDTD